MPTMLLINDVPIECINQAAMVYHVPASLIISVLRVENGRLGLASRNKNGTYDYGPMQVNSIWLNKLSRYGIRKEHLRDQPCSNVAVGAWILAQGISEAPELWRGVANYHSRTPEFNRKYQARVFRYYRHLMEALAKPPSKEARKAYGTTLYTPRAPTLRDSNESV